MSEKGSMTVAEAGKLGGASRRDSGADYRAMGRKGGAATSERHGPEFYAEIGRKGGEVVRRERGPEFFSEIGKKGGARVRALVQAGREALGGKGDG